MKFQKVTVHCPAHDTRLCLLWPDLHGARQGRTNRRPALHSADSSRPIRAQTVSLKWDKWAGCKCTLAGVYPTCLLSTLSTCPVNSWAAHQVPPTRPTLVPTLLRRTCLTRPGTLSKNRLRGKGTPCPNKEITLDHSFS